MKQKGASAGRGPVLNFMALQYFLTIEQEGSFSAASRRLFVSQQSLSESMKKLEAEVGAELFVRRRPLQLTEAGRRFAAGARQMLAARDEMMRDIEALSVRQRDHLTLAVSTFQAPPFLPELLQSFLAEHPQIEVSVIKRQVRGIARHLDDVDLYFSFLPLDPELEHIPLIEQDKLVLAVRRGLLAQHCPLPLEELAQRLSRSGGLRELETLPFILLHDRNGDEIELTSQLFRQAGFAPQVGFRSDNGELNLSMCVRGLGACIAPEDFLRRRLHKPLQEGDMLLLPIWTQERVCLALSYPKGRELGEKERCFIRAARRFLNP